VISDSHIEIHPKSESGAAWPAMLQPYAPAFYVDVGGHCNFACPYCSIDKSIPFREPEALERIVEIGGRSQLGTGIFIGGEPSIYPHLERVMEHGLRHGVHDYWIITNGSGLVHAARVARLAELGMKVWHLSWDHFDKRVLAAYHGSRPVLSNLMRAVENVCALPSPVVYLYQVVTAQTYPTLPQMVDFVADLRARLPAVGGLVAAMVKAVQEALKNPEVLYPLEDALPRLRDAEARARARSLPFWIFNLPPCVLPELEAITFSPFELDCTLDLATLKPSPSRAADTYCEKGPACLRCARFERCAGYFKTYAERFGTAPFQPPPSMRREAPLPPSALPVDSAGTREQGKLATQEPTPDEIARVTALLAAFAHAGARVAEVRWDATAPLPRWLVTLTSASDAAPLVVHLEPPAARASFLKSPSLALSYRGSELPAEHERLLRALFAYLHRPETAAVFAVSLEVTKDALALGRKPEEGER